MNWKVILLGLTILAIISLLAMYGLGISFGRGLQGFQNPSPDTNTFTMYYADWCPHCQSVKPEFSDFMGKSPMNVNGKSCEIRMIDAAKNPDAAKDKPVKGFPTFLLETTDGKIVEYPGKRNTEGWTKFINDSLGGGV